MELASVSGDDYEDIAAGLLQHRPRNRLAKARQLLADARARQHLIDTPRHFPPCGRCMRCQRGLGCQRRVHRDDDCPLMSTQDRAVHERRRREAQELADEP